jgi:PAS domain S-box-containing protein
MVGISQDMPECIAQESYFTRVVDASNAPIFSVDTRGNVTEWNKCAANIWGYTSEEAMGHQLVQEFITVEFSKSMQKVIDNALRGEETANFQVLLLTKQGTRVEILLNATSRRDAEGRVIGMLGVGQVGRN